MGSEAVLEAIAGDTGGVGTRCLRAEDDDGLAQRIDAVQESQRSDWACSKFLL